MTDVCEISQCGDAPQSPKKCKVQKLMGLFLFHKLSMRCMLTKLTAFDYKAPQRKEFDPVIDAMRNGNGDVILDILAGRFNEKVPVVSNKVLLVMHRLITQCNDDFDKQLMAQGSAVVFPSLHFEGHCAGIMSANQNLTLYENYLENLHFLIKTTRSLVPSAKRDQRCCLAFFNSVELDPMRILLPQLFTVVNLATKMRMCKGVIVKVGAAKCMMETLIQDTKDLLSFANSILKRALYHLEGCTTFQFTRTWIGHLAAYHKCLDHAGEFFSYATANSMGVAFGVPQSDSELSARLLSVVDSQAAEDATLEDMQYHLGELMVKEALIATNQQPILSRGDSTTSDSTPAKEMSLEATSSQGGDSLSASQGLTPYTISNLRSYGDSPFTHADVSVSDFATIQSEVNSLDTYRGFVMAPAGSKYTMSDDVNVTMESQYTIFLDELLGKGSFGSVYKGWDEDLGRHVACKQINQRLKAFEKSDASQTLAAVAELQTEFNVLKRLSHPNIVNVFDFEVTPTSSRIYMEWMPSGSVQSVLSRNKRNAGAIVGLREQVVRRYASEALNGLGYMHDNNIIHCDVKPANMLLDGNGVLKLSDLGTYKVLDNSNSVANGQSTVGTVPYLAPECFKGNYSAASDVWALGASVLQMISGRTPWEELGSLGSIDLMIAIRNRAAPDHAPSMSGVEMSNALRAFLSRCFEVDPTKRPSAKELLKDPFIAVCA